MLPTSCQPPCGDDFNPRYVKKCGLGPKCPNMVIQPQTPQKLKVLILFMFTRNDSLIRFQRALNHYLEMSLSQDMSKKCVFGPKCPNMVIWLYLAPYPQILCLWTETLLSHA